MTGNLTYGTLLDYAYSVGVYAFEIGIGNTPNLEGQAIQAIADENFEFVIEAVYLTYPDLSYDFDDPTETTCEEIEAGCDFYSVVDFTISIENGGGFDYVFCVNFTAGFVNDSDYALINASSSYQSEWDGYEVSSLNNYLEYDENNTVYYNVCDYAPAFSASDIRFTFSRAFQNSSADYEAVANLFADYNSFYVKPETKTNSGSIGGSSKSDGRGRGILVGIILLIVLIVMVFISGIVRNALEFNALEDLTLLTESGS